MPRSQKVIFDAAGLPTMALGWRPSDGQNFVPKTLTPQALYAAEKAEKLYVARARGVHGAARQTSSCPSEFPLVDDARVMIHMVMSDSASSWTTCWNGGYAMQEALTLRASWNTIVMQHPVVWRTTPVFADIILPVNTMFEEKRRRHVDNWLGAVQHDVTSEDDCNRCALGESKSDWECAMQEVGAQARNATAACTRTWLQRYDPGQVGRTSG